MRINFNHMHSKLEDKTVPEIIDILTKTDADKETMMTATQPYIDRHSISTFSDDYDEVLFSGVRVPLMALKTGDTKKTIRNEVCYPAKQLIAFISEGKTVLLYSEGYACVWGKGIAMWDNKYNHVFTIDEFMKSDKYFYAPNIVGFDI